MEFDASIVRCGVPLVPQEGDPNEVEGVLNPASARDRDGRLLLYPRCVAAGNISRVGIVRAEHGTLERLGYALEPHAPYELRPHPGYGCEDPRVTFIAALDRYVMAYTAFGPDGPRIAVALSPDAYHWERLGRVDFSACRPDDGDDKDAAFFPAPVLSPDGVLSLAMYHRPMQHLSAVDGRDAIPMLLAREPQERESISIGYVPLDAVLADHAALLTMRESAQVMSPNGAWGKVKLGAGTPPVRVAEGWLSLYHGVDATATDAGYDLRYAAGVVIHDAERPDRILYRSPAPIMVPETALERSGIVANVVFPTAIDLRSDLGERIFDVYYGMADARVGHARMTLGQEAVASAA
ncbi:MAG TPA: glycosidase [Candidatus Dormibacteraeota bacterium]|nr:glycosidase [Candidatus Dormibacteraeota bacterium]